MMMGDWWAAVTALGDTASISGCRRPVRCPWTELERIPVRPKCRHAGAPSSAELGPCPRETQRPEDLRLDQEKITSHQCYYALHSFIVACSGTGGTGILCRCS